MSRIVYVNGEYLPEEDAKISVFDRAFLMSDGVYEVSSVLDGKLLDNGEHLHRLKRSLDELRIPLPMPLHEIEAVQHEMLRRNNLREGSLYLQVTRGTADRDFTFPENAKPSLVMFTQVRSVQDNPAVGRGYSVVSMPDLRWKRRDIKTTQLLYPSMCKQAAVDQGADDAWLVEEGFVTEGTSNNAWIVKNGKLVTRQLSNDILHGITRKTLLRIAAEDGIGFEERPFTIEEAQSADEAFVTSATTVVMPVVRIDGKLVGNGNPGSVTLRLRQLYLEEMKRA